MVRKKAGPEPNAASPASSQLQHRLMPNLGRRYQQSGVYTCVSSGSPGGSLPFNQITAIRWSDPFVASWLAAASLEGAQEQHSTARPPNRQSPERSFLPITWCHASDTRAYYMAFKHERKMAFHVKRLTRKTSSEQSLRPGSHALKYTKVLSQCAISNSLNRTISLSSHLQL